LLLLIGAFVLASRSLKNSLYAVVFLAPWYGLDLDIGLRITIFQIFMIPLFLKTFQRIISQKITKPLLIFLFYCIVWSLGQFLFLPDLEVSGGSLRSPELRSFVQIFMLLLTIAPFIAAQKIIKTRRELFMVGKVYILSCLCLALIGWIQLYVWHATGSNPFPIGFTDGLLGGRAEVRSAFFNFLDKTMYRMNSLGGEPKNLGAAFAIGLLLLQATASVWNISRGRLIWLWLILACSMIATSSTTAFLLWLIGSFVLIISQFMFRQYANSKVSYSRKTVTFSIVAFAILITFVFIAEEIGVPVTDLVMSRTVNRIQESESGPFEDFDSAVLDYLIDNPTQSIAGVGLGNIHLYARAYLSPIAFTYAGGSVFTAKAQYLRLISEVGFVGFILFLYWVYSLLKMRNRGIIAPANLVHANMLAKFGLIMLIIYMAAGSVAPQFYLTMGAIAANITAE
jgi:hypothetical protein